MSTNVTAILRTGRKSELRRAREAGQVPGVVYGQGQPATSILMDKKVLQTLLGQISASTVLKLSIEGAETANLDVMMKDLQMDPIRREPVHIDWQIVDLDQPVTIGVSVVLTGTAAGTKEGGIVQPGLRELEVKAKPNELPERLELDISELDIGQNLTAGDVKLPVGVELISDPTETVVTIVAPTLAAEEAEEAAEGDAEAAAEGEEAAEPETGN